MLYTILDAAILLVLVALSAFFSGTECAFLSISTVRLHSLLERGVPGAASLARLREKRRRVVISILIGNNVLNIAASAYATSIAIAAYGDEGVGIAVGVMTLVILTLGDIIPKSVATIYGERIMLAVSPIMEIFYYATYPLVILFEQFNRLIPGIYARPTGVERFTEAEVRSAVKLGAMHKGITKKEKDLIENVLEFNDRTVGEAMTPKAAVVTLHTDMIVATAHKIALESKYSRFPVIDGQGKVVGTLSVKIIGRAFYEHPDWSVGKIAWKPVAFNETEKASIAFSHLQSIGRNIAIVVDDKGSFRGVVTLEDLLEELVGELK